jgi:hypothetical protein
MTIKADKANGIASQTPSPEALYNTAQQYIESSANNGHFYINLSGAFWQNPPVEEAVSMLTNEGYVVTTTTTGIKVSWV